MTFSSLWPLAFLIAIPVIVILYILKPRGEDRKVSSNLLWQKILKNNQSRTFFEKFTNNILMYIQIIIAVLLTLALMSPFIMKEGEGGGNTVILIDNSASMQHMTADGVTRLEDAVENAKRYIDSSEGRFTVISCSDDAELLISGSPDKEKLKSVLSQIQAEDTAGNLGEAESLVATVLSGQTDHEEYSLYIFTDGDGIDETAYYTETMDTDIYVAGTAVSNVSVDYVAYTETDYGFDVAVRITNYSDFDAALEMSLYEADGALPEGAAGAEAEAGSITPGIGCGTEAETENILSIKQAEVEAGKSTVILFEDVAWSREILMASAVSISFTGEAEGSYEGDSLKKDNTAYAVREGAGDINALLTGRNTFIENAYRAVTGNDITKSETDTVSAGDTEYGVLIYDGVSPSPGLDTNRLIFGLSAEEITPAGEDGAGQVTFSAGEGEGSLLEVSECELTAGLSGFEIGVNHVYFYECPDWAESFLAYDGKCAGYFGEHDGVREVVMGFDLRESDFALKAEYPVIFANIMSYLSDSSILAGNVYYAGESVIFNASSDFNYEDYDTETAVSGVYRIYTGEESECFVVRFASAEESDGRTMGEAVSGENITDKIQIRQSLRGIILIIVIILLVIEWIIYVKQNRYRGRFYLAVRVVLTVIIILAAAGIRLPSRSDRTVTIFVVDMSDSAAAHTEEINDYIRSQISDMPKNNSYGIVTFGRHAEVEQFVTDGAFFSEIMTSPDVNATNLEEAVNKAASMIPGDAAGRLVIITDGRETNGDIFNTAGLITRSNISVASVLLETPETDDCYVDNVDIPAYLHQGDSYRLTVSVMSNYDTEATLSIETGDSEIMQSAVTLKEGKNQFAFSQTVSDDVMESFTVTVNAPGDGCEVNNSYSVYSMVESTPHILIVQGKGENIDSFLPVLAAAGSDYEVVTADMAPETISEMLDYKSIILADVYYDDLPEGFKNNLKAYVEDYAGGLICAGGENSFALGGYRDTVLEEVLPVNMELRGENEIPEMAMVMVIDHSGSMLEPAGSGGATNLDIAIQAAMSAVDNLREDDYVGVLTFDDTFTWQVELVKASDKDGIKEKIREVSNGGGTSIKPALEEAYRALLSNDATIKHIVLLTDGYGEGSLSDYNSVTESINEAGITLSTVAVGRDSDRLLLENLANACGGRYYYSDISTDIPRIFAQEVYLSGDTYIQNGSFSLSASQSDRVTGGIFESGWPILNGYISSTPKQNSNVLIASDKDDPILTVWQCGLGKTAAWNTDITGEWTANFSGQDDYVQLWKRIIDYTSGSAGLNDDITEVRNEAGHTVISYTARDYTDETAVSAVYMDENGEMHETELVCTAPGVFEAELSEENPGVYSINVRRAEGDEIANSINTAYAVQYSAEYRFDVDSADYESFVERYGNSATFSDSVWSRLKNENRRSYDITEILLIMAIILLLADISLRRFYVMPKKGLLKNLGRGVSLRAGRAKEKAPAGSRRDADGSGGSDNDTAEAASGNADGMTVENAQADEAAKKIRKNPMSGSMKKGRKKAPQQAETLDTSALLKKKRDRE